MEPQASTVGVVKWFDCKKGFGFLVDDQGRDVFVHHTVIAATGFRRLREGERVEYIPMSGPKGLAAAWARQISGGARAADTRPSPPADTMEKADVGPLRWSRMAKGGCP